MATGRRGSRGQPAGLPSWEVPGYEPLRRLGPGAGGGVWLARDEATGASVTVRRVALPGAGRVEEAIRRAAALAGAAHPHLARLLAAVPLREGLALVGEEEPAPTVAALLAARARLDPGEAVTLLVPVAQALAAVHAVGQAHGRVSVESVRVDAQGRPVLAAVGEGLDVRAGSPAGDVWALAAVGWHALTGQPYEASGGTPLPRLAPGVPRPLAALLTSVLDAPAERRPSAAQLAAAVFDTCTALPLTLPAGTASGPVEAPSPAVGSLRFSGDPDSAPGRGPGTGRAGSRRPGSGRPGTGRPGTGRPGTGRPGARRAVDGGGRAGRGGRRRGAPAGQRGGLAAVLPHGAAPVVLVLGALAIAVTVAVGLAAVLLQPGERPHGTAALAVEASPSRYSEESPSPPREAPSVADGPVRAPALEPPSPAGSPIPASPASPAGLPADLDRPPASPEGADPTRWPDVLAGLDAQRSQAFATGDEQALAAAYAPRAPALARDRDLLGRHLSAGYRARGLRLQVLSVHPVEEAAAPRVALRVRDRMPDYDVVDAAGVEHPVEGRDERWWTVVLTPVGGEWRYWDVRPAAGAAP
ncbi:serine/threonine-protein kinase [Motilibacter aurantiacus]|uniref:hypothetical protein n=1 Tax=Motilibacter aurantiacus TaxID=2714955 RepID=UPI00140A46B4|nr:hypothetical protein [Motilibacter aurantiacus]NHC44943.1 hypothetical protein [Motilibacter aurantiacus]